MVPLIAAILMAPQHAAMPAPSEIFESLFGAAIPKKVKVVRHFNDGPGMDPSFSWKLSPADRAFVKKVLRSAKLKRSPAPVGSSDRWPSTWPHGKVDRLREAYSREFQDGGHRHLWVDPKGNRIFAEFLGT